MRLDIALALVFLSASAGAARAPGNVVTAVDHGDLAAVKSFVAGGGDVNATGWNNESLLAEAIDSERPDVAKFLIDKGATLFDPRTRYDSWFQLAVRASLDPHSLQVLIDRGADLNGNIRGTPLFFVDQGEVGQQRKKDIVGFLLSKGIAINATDTLDQTVLGLVASNKNDEADLAKYLIAHGADVHIRDRMAGYTVLDRAIAAGNMRVAELLIANGATLDEQSGTNSNVPDPLELAIKTGHYDLALRLVQLGARTNKYSSDEVAQAMDAARYDLTKSLVAHGASSRGVDLRVRPPAYWGASCAKDKPAWKRDGDVAEVTGEAKLFMHPDYPATCAARDSACEGKTFLIQGNRVTLGVACGTWTDVQFQGRDGTSWGWVESARLVPIKTKVSALEIDTPPVPAPSVCSVASGNLGEGGVSADKPLNPLPEFPLNFQPLAWEQASKLQKPDDYVSRDEFADATIDGQPVEVVHGTMDGNCPSKNIEIWSPKFDNKLYVADSNLDDSKLDDSSEHLRAYDGKTYLERDQQGGSTIWLYNLDRNFSPRLQCELSREALQPERVASAVDASLCDAVVAGKVEVIPLDKSDPVQMDAEALRFGSDAPSSGMDYTLTDRATLDLYNDGHPRTIAKVSIDPTPTDPPNQDACDESDDDTSQIHYESLVVLDKNGLPDLSAAPMPAVADNATPIRYGGMIYIDTHAYDDSDTPEHRIWKVTNNGSAVVCSFVSQHYAIQH